MNVRYTGKHRSIQSGQAIVLMALAMVGLLAFVILAIDGGRFYAQRRQSQNASDMAALGGLYKFATLLSSATFTSTITDAQAMQEIVRVAQMNQIADTDGNSNNNINANVQAWWVNSTGGILRQLDPASNNPPPSGTTAVKVMTYIPYPTFIGGLIGQKNLTAESESVARLTLNFKTFTDDKKSMWVGGGDCNDLDQKIAHNYSNTNSAKFTSGAYIDGSLAVGSVNSPYFGGDMTVNWITGVSTGSGNNAADGPYVPINPANANPFNNNATWANGSQFVPPPASPTAKGFPNWTYVTINNVKTRIDANSFKPGTGYFYTQYAAAYGAGIMPAPWNTIPVDTFYNTIAGSTDGTVTLANIKTAYAANKRGIYWIDGNLTIPNNQGPKSNSPWTGITIILTGKFDNQDSNAEFDTAGKMAMNISVLAGADLAVKDVNGNVTDMSPRCASNKANAVFKVVGNDNQFHGIIYVPYGQSYFEGNTSGGANAAAFSKGVVTYSAYLGSRDASANSWQFDFDPTMFVQPFPSTELNN